MPMLSKYVAEMYKNLTPSRKEKYNNLASEKRRRYENKMEIFYRNHPEFAPKTKREKTQKENRVTVHPPKKPFKIFYESQLQAEPNTDKNTLLEVCKEQWKLMGDKNKLRWIDLALEHEEKYNKYMKDSGVSDGTQTPKQSLLTKDERSLKERMAGKPDKPPTSAYSLYSRLMLTSEKFKTFKPKNRMLSIAMEWKNCTPEEKNEYKERASHMMEQYKLEYATYLESLPESKRLEELNNNQPKRKLKDTKLPVKVAPPVKKPKVNSQEKEYYTPPTAKILYEGEPKQPPVTAVLLFAQKATKGKLLTKKEVEAMWSNLSADEKNKYRNKLRELKHKYINNYELFLRALSPEQLKEYSRLKSAHKQIKSENSNDSDSDSVTDAIDNENDVDCSDSSSDSSDENSDSEEDENAEDSS